MVETVLAIYMMFFNLVKNWITGYSQYAEYRERFYRHLRSVEHGYIGIVESPWREAPAFSSFDQLHALLSNKGVTSVERDAFAVFCCKKKLYEPSAIVKGMLSSPSDAESVKSRLNILLKCLSTPDDSDEIGAINELLKNLSGDL